MLLIWRNLSVYEMADQFVSLRMRSLTVPAMMFLLSADLLAFLVNVMRPDSFKNQLKAVLALNTLREYVELLYNAFKLVSSSRYAPIPRDIYIGRFFMNVWWSAFCVSFIKSRWVANFVAGRRSTNSPLSSSSPSMDERSRFSSNHNNNNQYQYSSAQSRHYDSFQDESTS